MSKAKFKAGDKVKILDGKGIFDYTGGWNPFYMTKHVGNVATVRAAETILSGRIGYRLSGNGYLWDERCLQLVAEAKPRKIIVMQDKADPMKVIARDLDTGKVGVAQCSPQDSFDFYTGAKLAFDRLMGREEKKPEEPKPEPEKPLNMKVVCVELGTGMFGNEPRWWTLGKVYNVIGGIIRDDDGDKRKPVCSLVELNKQMTRYAKFVEYKGGA